MSKCTRYTEFRRKPFPFILVYEDSGKFVCLFFDKCQGGAVPSLVQARARGSEASSSKVAPQLAMVAFFQAS
jgi:hypothetical protein